MEKVPDWFTDPSKARMARMSKEAGEEQDHINRQIGALIMSWANGESAFFSIAYFLLGTDKTGAEIAYRSLSSNYARMNYLQTLGKSRLDAPLCEELFSLIRKFKFPTKIRNEFAHAEYIMNSSLRIIGTRSVDCSNADSEFKVVEKPMDDKRALEVHQAIVNLNELSGEIWSFYNKLIESRS